MVAFATNYCGAAGGLFSSPPEVPDGASGVALLCPVVSGGSVAAASGGSLAAGGGVLEGTPSVDPDGRTASPLDDGSEVSAAKAVALLISMAAKSRI